MAISHIDFRIATCLWMSKIYNNTLRPGEARCMGQETRKAVSLKMLLFIFVVQSRVVIRKYV